MPRNHNPNINTPEYWDAVYREEIARGELRDATERFDAVLDFVPHGQRMMLDYGCGAGAFCRRFSKWALSFTPPWTIVGYDWSGVAREHAQRMLGNRAFIVAELKPRDTFGFIHCGEVFEHVSDPHKLADELIGRLTVGGVLVVTAPYKYTMLDKEHVWEYDADEMFAILGRGISNPITFRIVDERYLLAAVEKRTQA